MNKSKKARLELRKAERKKLEDWKFQVCGRDKWACAKCKKSMKGEKYLNVHHILPDVTKYASTRTDINNGILLCAYCHRFSPDSPHTNALEFSRWLMHARSYQYVYLVTHLINTNGVVKE
jgi:ubiquitin C-terminal hydrolase